MKLIKQFLGFGLCLMFIGGCVAAKAPAPSSAAGEDPMLAGYLAAGASLEKEGNLSEALVQYRLALTVAPDNSQAKDRSKAVETLLKERAENHYKEGLDYEKAGKEAKARKSFLAALQNWPDHPEARKRLTPGLVMDTKSFVVHIIASGESISKLAKLYYDDYKRYPVISLFNRIKDPTRIFIGQEIKVPEIEGFPLSVLKKTREQYLAGQSSPSGDEAVQESKQYEKEMSEVVHEASSAYDSGAQSVASSPSGEGEKPLAGETPASAASQPADEKKEVEPRPETTGATPEQTPAAALEKPAPKGHESISEEQPDYLSQGIEYFDQKQYQEAIVELRKASEAMPGDATVTDYLFRSHFQYGLALFSKEAYLEARDNFQAAYAVNKECKNCPEYVEKCVETYKEKHYTKGIVFFGKEELKEAIKEWELVEAIDPEYKKLSANLKKARLLNERLEKIKQGQSD